MTKPLKKIGSQAIVITGATSGIGLTTARAAAARGAGLVLAARDSDALDQLVAELRAQGADAIAVPTDVGVRGEVEALGLAAMQRYGRIDTWVNNAGVSIYGRYQDVPLADQQRLFQTNFWGVVHGSLVALDMMREGGGAIINLGSELSDRAVPLQGMYSASKHAVKGFTDSLRMEVEKDGLPVSLTLIKPAGIDTLYTKHARNYMENEPELPAPLYAPDLVADAILYAAESGGRDIYVGGAARMISAEGTLMPRLLDKLMNAIMFKQQNTGEPSAPGRQDSLYASSGPRLRERLGDHVSNVHEHSAYTYLTTRGKPLGIGLLIGAVAIGVLAVAGSEAKRESV
ncbi:UNVERIFIED_ORG: short-subunit dehydrogenase [Zoogloea ramigera]|uniref:SDR family oxidoreductase n=1 Tax=Duganella zoogloeoides TaxID=75659 RepID=A0ABZ0Y5M7_9BURK|nr:SDR family oxidoreductase [Duganella zoogloeoides]WQH06605.1 SDR family oxidoreductase [Duganella zoogloeoides]